MGIKIAASILSARFDRLGDQVKEAGEAGADLLHIDIMDGPCVPYLTDVSLLLVMTVHPGFSGQAFRAEVVPKIHEARAYIDKEGLDVEVEVDGGIKVDTAPIVAKAGADILVSGSGIFPDRVRENLKAIRAAAEQARAR